MSIESLITGAMDLASDALNTATQAANTAATQATALVNDTADAVYAKVLAETGSEAAAQAAKLEVTDRLL